MEPQEFTNMDGVKATLQPWDADMLNERGYTATIPIRGEVGWTELGIHTKKTENIGVIAFVREDSARYAFVLLDDDTLLDGVFNRFNNGTFSVA